MVMFLVLHTMVFIFLILFVLLENSFVLLIIIIISVRYHNFVKRFQNFTDDISTGYLNNVGLRTLLLQGISEPEFYGDVVYIQKNNL